MKLIKKYEKIMTLNDSSANNSSSLSSSKFFADIVNDFIKSRDRSRKIVIIASTITAMILRKSIVITLSTSDFTKQSSSSSEISSSFAVVLRRFIVVISALTMIEFVVFSKIFNDISSSSKAFIFRKTLKKVFDNALRRSARLLKEFKNKD